MKYTKPTGKTLALGKAAEDAAARFLEQAGLIIIERNFRCKGGELDIIAREGDILAFIEIRMRSHPDFGSGLDSVDFTKQRKLIQAARYFLQVRKYHDQLPCRFDIVSVRSSSDIAWIRDAFQTC